MTATSVTTVLHASWCRKPLAVLLLSPLALLLLSCSLPLCAKPYTPHVALCRIQHKAWSCSFSSCSFLQRRAHVYMTLCAVYACILLDLYTAGMEGCLYARVADGVRRPCWVRRRQRLRETRRDAASEDFVRVRRVIERWRSVLDERT